MSQPYNPYGQPPPPPQHKKKRGGTILVVIAGVVLLFGGCAAIISAAGGDEPTTATAEQAGGSKPKKAKAAEPEESEQTAGIGDTVQDGKFSFKVTKVERRDRVGNEFIGSDAQGVFLLVHVTVKNVGDEARAFASSAQKLHADGKEYEADAGAAIYMEDSKSLYEQINPGNSVKGIVLFDVPKDLKPETVELHDSLFSGGVTVSLR